MVYEQLPSGFQQDMLRNHRGDMAKINKLLSMEYVSNMNAVDLGALKLPVLLLSGDRDESFALVDVISTYQSLPEAELWIEPGLNHSLYWAEWGGSSALEKSFPVRAKQFLSH